VRVKCVAGFTAKYRLKLYFTNKCKVVQLYKQVYLTKENGEIFCFLPFCQIVIHLMH